MTISRRDFWIAFVVGVISYSLGASSHRDSNEKMAFGDTGLPKNCRAIIAANITAWQNKQYPANEIFESIDRNCGANGHSWK